MRTFAQTSSQPATTGSAHFARPQKDTSVPPIVNEVLHSSGKQLDAVTRASMEPRFGHDFSRVRVHTDAKAAQSASALGAQAYTLGPNIVFGAGQYNPQGSRLLAHELAHHVQQESRSPFGEIEIAPEHTPFEREAAAASERVVQGGPVPGLTSAPPRIQRQKTPTTTAPAFSVVQADYLKLVQSAIQQMSGNIVASNTLANQINPILSEMLAHVTWRDEQGKDHGGGSFTHTLPLKPPVKLDLQLILDDKTDPLDGGLFVSKGNSGTIFVRIRKNATADDLSLTMFHEALHMMSWFVNKFGFSPTSNPNDRESRVLRMSRHAAPIRTTGAWLQQLAQGVNSRRAAGQPQLKDTDVQSTAEWLVGEVVVRAETEVFRLASAAQQAQQSHAPQVIPGTPEGIEVSPKMVDTYLFDLSQRFLPADRAGLDAADREVIAKIAEILDKYFEISVQQRFSLTPYTMKAPQPQLPDLSPTLPSKPSFIDKIQPPD